MRILLFGLLPFDPDDVPRAQLEELRLYAELENKSLQALIEDVIRETGLPGAFFNSIDPSKKNFALDCSNFQQVAKKSTKH